MGLQRVWDGRWDSDVIVHDSLSLLFTSGEKQAGIMVKYVLLLHIFLSTFSVLKCLKILLQHPGKFTGCGPTMKAEFICLVSLLARCVNLNYYCSRIMAFVQHIVIKRKKNPYVNKASRPTVANWPCTVCWAHSGTCDHLTNKQSIQDNECWHSPHGVVDLHTTHLGVKTHIEH